MAPHSTSEVKERHPSDDHQDTVIIRETSCSGQPPPPPSTTITTHLASPHPMTYTNGDKGNIHSEDDKQQTAPAAAATNGFLKRNLGVCDSSCHCVSLDPHHEGKCQKEMDLNKTKHHHHYHDDDHHEPHQSPDVDGGWAWVVFVAGFLQFLVSSGMYYSFSIFYVELLQAFGESRAKTGWVYSTNSAVHMFSGPLGGFVVVRWGPRTAIMLGGLIAALGYFLTAFAPSLNVVFVTYSFINAIGTNLNFSGWIVGLARFWNRHHALVLGIVMSGSGCGLFLLGPSMEHIVLQFGWRGAMIICSGLSLNFCVFGATVYTNFINPDVLSKDTSCREKHPLISDNLFSEKPVNRSKDDLSSNSELSHSSNDTTMSNMQWEGESFIVETPSLTSQIILGSSWSLSKSHILDNKWEKFLCRRKSLKTSSKSKEVSTKPNPEVAIEKESVKQLLLSAKFWLLEISCFLSFMATTTLFAVFLDWTRWKGLSSYFPHALASSGAGDLAGRFFAGVLMGKGLPPLILFSGIQLLLATMIGCAALASSGTQLILAMGGFGIACGLQSVLYALMPSQLSSGVGMARVLGYLLIVTGAGALTGPPVAGLLVDLTDSYDAVMLLCTVAPTLASVFNLAAHFMDRRRRQRMHSSCVSPQDQNSV